MIWTPCQTDFNSFPFAAIFFAHRNRGKNSVAVRPILTSQFYFLRVKQLKCVLFL